MIRGIRSADPLRHGWRSGAYREVLMACRQRESSYHPAPCIGIRVLPVLMSEPE